MRVADTFRVVRRQREPEPQILLADIDGRTLNLPAASLLAQYATDQGDVLLVLDEDTPYEEALHLVLIREAAVLDHLVIGAPYAAGVFEPVDAHENALRFRFGEAEPWRLIVGESGSRWPRPLPAGVRRRSGWLATRYLDLARDVEEA